MQRQWFSIEPIQCVEEVNEFLKVNDISADDFDLIRHNSSLSDLEAFAIRQKNKEPATDSVRRKFFTRHLLYSYGAITYAKLLTKTGLDIRAFNYSRPSSTISTLAEKPNMLMAAIRLRRYRWNRVELPAAGAGS